MKLTYFQLETHLAKTLSPAYIISGDEPFLKNEAINLIRKAAKQAQFTERSRITIQTGLDETQVYNLFHTNSFLSDKRLIEIDCQDNLPNKSIATILTDYATKPNSDTLVLLITAKVDAKIAKADWFKAYDKIGMHVAIWPIPSEQLPQWLNQRARKYKLNLTMAQCSLISEFVAGNITAAAQVIEKLYLLKTDGAITDDLIRLVISDESRFSVFDLMDYILANDVAHILQVLTSLKCEGIEPTLILWGLTRELRMLLELAEQAAKNTPIDSLLQKHRIFPRRQPHVRRFLQRVNVKQCQSLLAKAAGIDHILKGAVPGNVWQALELYCLQLAITSG